MLKQLKTFIKDLNQRYQVDDLNTELEYSPELLSVNDPFCFIAQQYKQLAGTIVNNQIFRNSQSILFTSPQPGDGKSTTISNIAYCLARYFNKQVLVLDADYYRPKIGSIFKLDFKKYERKLNDMLLLYSSMHENLKLIPVQDEYVTAEFLEDVVDVLPDLKLEFDYILFDSPPVLKVVDSALLSQEVDSIIMVGRAQDTPQKIVDEAIDLLKKNSIDITAGICVNTANNVDVYNYFLNPHYRRYYHNYYHGYGKKP